MTTRISESAVVSGPPALVWRLVTDPAHFQRWYAFGGAEIDLRPGGVMILRWDEHGAFEAVVEAVIPERLFSFRWQFDPGPLVEITLSAEGDDETRVEIAESGGLEDPEQSAHAWRNGLALLSRLAWEHSSGSV